MDEKNALWRALLAAESPTGNALKPLWEPAVPVSSPFGSLAPSSNPLTRPDLFGGLFGLGESIGRQALPIAPSSAPGPAIPVVPIERRTYFAFDFDDILRVNNVRQSGKMGPRINNNSRGFKDRSVWEKSNARTNDGLKRFMRRAVEHSGIVCVLIGATTWQSFWVRYEVALSVVGGRGLLVLDLNSINHHERKAPDPLGVNPLHFMGVCKHNNGNWYLVERVVIETPSGPEFQWQWYDQYTKSVTRPAYIPDVDGTVMPLANYTDRHDFKADGGAGKLALWLDVAAKRAGR